MAGFRSVSIVAKIVFACIIIGLLLFIIGLAVDYWHVVPSYLVEGESRPGFHHGIWTHKDPGKDWVLAVQIMLCIGLLFGLASLVVITLYIFVHTHARHRTVAIYNLILCFITASFIVVGVAIFGDQINDPISLGWGYALTTAGAIFYAVAGGLLVVEHHTDEEM